MRSYSGTFKVEGSKETMAKQVRVPLPQGRRSEKTGARLKPTAKHRPFLWENMFGTVFAANAKGKIEYFDYDYAKALKFAGVDPRTADIRVARYCDGHYNQRGNLRDPHNYMAPRERQWVWWVAPQED